MDEDGNLGACLSALANLENAVGKATGITYEMLTAGADLSSRPDYSAFVRVQFMGGNLRYQPITEEEFYTHAGDGGTVV